MNSPQPTPPVTYPVADDEIDLGELVRNLWASRGLIAGITLLCLALAGGYLAITPPVYISDARVDEPSTQQTLTLAPQPIDNFTLTSEVLFKRFVQLVESKTLQADYFQSQLPEDLKGDADATKGWIESRLKAFKVTRPRSKDGDTAVTLSLEANSADQAQTDLSELIKRANATALRLLEEDYRAVLDANIRTLERKIIELRATHNETVRARIAQLDEALQIARKLGIEQDESFKAVGGALSPEGAPNRAGGVIQVVDIPLYLKGTRTLSALKASWEARLNQDAFVAGLAEVKAKLDTLKRIETKTFAGQTFTLIDPPSNPLDPAKPKRALVMALAGVLGLMLGVFAALIRRAFRD
ncbi:Wzz/FepE/Etk N-terminal domain-containing protein [Hahella sp. SMD15-11]|uniref:Wzz/FepE/Etk N-terminal domain-containing protein n=1 Tax=Thermohahella caldifontis TaxID=3142973 RepID=A0AB39USF6_9GAMM